MFKNLKMWRSWSSLFDYIHVEINLGLFLRGYIVAMVTYKVEKTTITSSPIMRHIWLILIQLSLYQLVKSGGIDPSNLSAGKNWQPAAATLKREP